MAFSIGSEKPVEFCVLCEKMTVNLKDHVLCDHRQAMALRFGLKDWLEEVTKRASTSESSVQTFDHHYSFNGVLPGDMSPAEAESAQQAVSTKKEIALTGPCIMMGQSAKRAPARSRMGAIELAQGKIPAPGTVHGQGKLSPDMDTSQEASYGMTSNEAEALDGPLASNSNEITRHCGPSLAKELDRIQNAITISSESMETVDTKSIITRITQQNPLNASELPGADANQTTPLLGWMDHSALSFGVGQTEGEDEDGQQTQKRSRKRTKDKVEECALCGESTSKKQHHALYKHFDSHLFKCADCNYGSKHYNGMLRHINLSHNKNSLNQAAQFFRVEENYRNLWEVQKACFSRSRVGGKNGSSDKPAVVVLHVAADVQKKIECSLCHQRVSSDRGPKDHVVGAHLKVPLYKCSECDYSSKRAFNIASHIVKGKLHPGLGKVVPIEENRKVAEQLQKHCFPKNEENYFAANSDNSCWTDALYSNDDSITATVQVEPESVDF